MFFRNITEYNRKFHLLNIVSDLVFSFWTSTDAIAYREGELMQMQDRYRSFISEMDALTKELDMLQRHADELEAKINNDINEINLICSNPFIQGCQEIIAEGVVIDHNGKEQKRKMSFAIRPNEVHNIRELADKRATRLTRIDDVKTGHAL